MDVEVYQVWTTKNAQLCQPVGDDGFEGLRNRVNGRPQEKAWRVPEMKLVNVDEGCRLETVDAPYVGPSFLALRERAASAMGGFLEGHGELLELGGDARGIFLFNPWLIDCLDESSCLLDYYSDGVRVMDIEEYVFFEDKVSEIDIFKLPIFSVSCIYVSERFVNAWRKLGLTGLRFQKLWSSGLPRFEPFFPKW